MPDSAVAPTYAVPGLEVVAVEHPCIIKNADKGIDMLGGSSAIRNILEPNSTRSLGLSFHPENPDSRTVLSITNEVDNALLRITVPKCIGKRKRGSKDAYIPLSVDEKKKDARRLIQSLHDNEANSTVEAVGAIKHSHIWRSIPDFVYSAKASDFLSHVKSKILPKDYASFKDFDMHRTYGRRGTEAIPPPALSTVSFPTQYSYRQSMHVQEVVDPQTGQRTLQLPPAQKNTKTFTTSVRIVDEVFPVAPRKNLPRISTQPKPVQYLQPILTKLFEQRPIWSRRALINNLPDDEGIEFDKLRFSLGYVAFAIRSGPWRDTLCRYGVDPRTSPEYRKYQTVMFQIPKPGQERGAEALRFWGRSKDKTSHMFSGNLPMPLDGSIWQLCDLEDPQLKALVDVDESQLRDDCDKKYFGWYENGTDSKIRAVMKAKIEALLKSERVDDKEFDRFLTLPNRLNQYNMKEVDRDDPVYGFLPLPMTGLENVLASNYRNMCRNVEHRIKRGNRKTDYQPFEVEAVEPDEGNEEDAALDEASPVLPSPSKEVTNVDEEDEGENAPSTRDSKDHEPGAQHTSFEDAWH